MERTEEVQQNRDKGILLFIDRARKVKETHDVDGDRELTNV